MAMSIRAGVRLIMRTYAIKNGFSGGAFAYSTPIVRLNIVPRHCQILSLGPVLREMTFFKDPNATILTVIFHMSFDRKNLVRITLG